MAAGAIFVLEVEGRRYCDCSRAGQCEDSSNRNGNRGQSINQ